MIHDNTSNRSNIDLIRLQYHLPYRVLYLLPWICFCLMYAHHSYSSYTLIIPSYLLLLLPVCHLIFLHLFLQFPPPDSIFIYYFV